jgi:hypothetical protein
MRMTRPSLVAAPVLPEESARTKRGYKEDTQ